MSYRVFLSHASCDRPLAEHLKAEIERFDVTVYMYEHDVQPGARLPSKLVAQIRAVDALLVLLTKEGGSSQAVNQEIGVAVGSHRLVIPLIEEGVDPAQFTLLQGLEWLPFQRDEPEALRRSVADYLERKRRGKTKSQMIGAALIAGLLLWGSTTEENDDDED